MSGLRINNKNTLIPIKNPNIHCSKSFIFFVFVVRTGFEPMMPNNGSVHSLPGIEPVPPPDLISSNFTKHVC